jgi:arsenate reductase
MKRYFREELLDIQGQLQALAGEVVRNVGTALDSVLATDPVLAVRAIETDHEIDRREVRLEEECIKIIALHQPVADDLRYLVAVLKINHDLERISDLASSVAKKVHLLERETTLPYHDALLTITDRVRRAIQASVEAVLRRDGEQARQVWLEDDEIDTLTTEFSVRLQKALVERYEQRDAVFALLRITQALERMADHAANIAKHVIYLVMGTIVRHRLSEFRGKEERRRPRVLFVCVHNSARSQMAAAWVNRLFGDRLEAESAGLQPGTLNPLAVEVMREVGIDISGSPTRDVFNLVRSGHPFSYVITVCDEASAEKCPPFLGLQGEMHWSFPDPATLKGTEEERLEKIREIRDAIRLRIQTWVSELKET